MNISDVKDGDYIRVVIAHTRKPYAIEGYAYVDAAEGVHIGSCRLDGRNALNILSIEKLPRPVKNGSVLAVAPVEDEDNFDDEQELYFYYDGAIYSGRKPDNQGGWFYLGEPWDSSLTNRSYEVLWEPND